MAKLESDRRLFGEKVCKCRKMVRQRPSKRTNSRISWSSWCISFGGCGRRGAAAFLEDVDLARDGIAGGDGGGRFLDGRSNRRLGQRGRRIWSTRHLWAICVLIRMLSFRCVRVMHCDNGDGMASGLPQMMKP